MNEQRQLERLLETYSPERMIEPEAILSKCIAYSGRDAYFIELVTEKDDVEQLNELNTITYYSSSYILLPDTIIIAGHKLLESQNTYQWCKVLYALKYVPLQKAFCYTLKRYEDFEGVLNTLNDEQLTYKKTFMMILLIHWFEWMVKAGTNLWSYEDKRQVYKDDEIALKLKEEARPIREEWFKELPSRIDQIIHLFASFIPPEKMLKWSCQQQLLTVQYHTELKDKGFIIYIQRNTPDILNIKSIYKNSYSLFTPLVKDFVRTSLYNLFAGFIPTDKKTRAAYINRVFNDKRETYTLSPADYGELNDVYERIKDSQMDVDQFLNYVMEKNSTRQKQTVDDADIGDVEKVVSTAGMATDNKENERIPKKAPDALVAQPPILEMDNDTDKKLLFTNAVSPVLHGNQMFLALSDKMDRFNRPFFLLPHTTRVIWSMHRIIYIFTDITSSVSF